MIYIVRVNVSSLNRPSLVDAAVEGALEGTCTCVRNIEDGDSAVRSVQDAVIYIARVKGNCRDRPCRVEEIDDKHHGALAGACSRVRRVECGDRTVRSAQESV